MIATNFKNPLFFLVANIFEKRFLKALGRFITHKKDAFNPPYSATLTLNGWRFYD